MALIMLGGSPRYPLIDPDDPVGRGYLALRRCAGAVWLAGDDTVDLELQRLLAQAAATGAMPAVADAVARIAAAAHRWQRARAAGDAAAIAAAMAGYASAYGLLQQRIRYDLGIDARPPVVWRWRRAVLPYRPAG